MLTNAIIYGQKQLVINNLFALYSFAVLSNLYIVLTKANTVELC